MLKGDANAIWIFQIASDFTTVGGAGGMLSSEEVLRLKSLLADWQFSDYWRLYLISRKHIGLDLHNDEFTLQLPVGRMLARNGAVVLTSTNIINKP